MEELTNPCYLDEQHPLPRPTKNDSPDVDQFLASLSTYFSLQEASLQPVCIVSPTATEDVATAIRTLSISANGDADSRCDFAIRSGGHAVTAGAANIAGGVTLDLRGLKSIHVSDDRSTARIGAGLTWGQVYAELDSHGLTVAGGRVGEVGVGGLTIGGGISYHSPRFGWTCDGVSNFEVVLADGYVINANEKENKGLLLALRGGSNNFGVVTRMDMSTFEQGPILGGMVGHSIDTIDAQLEALHRFNSADEYDEYASLITTVSYSSAKGAAITNSIEHTKAKERPAVFEPFLQIPSRYKSLKLGTMAQAAREQASFLQKNRRQVFSFSSQTFATVTHGSSLEMLNAAFLRWNQSLEAIRHVHNVAWMISFEPLPPNIYAHSPESNSLGFGNKSGALMVTLLNAQWSHEADDYLIEETARELIARIEADARRLKEYDPFVYLNYAAPWQDPFAGYGSDSLERLKKTRDEVDPGHVFTIQVPGGFKIPA
ncbi:hypothetical protein S40288_04113 [Stachybotrys chartarum IBT 40288]|nr:hypothetical protein S40288_04113 [Stachybotrys chartarum IBT 40288]